MDTGPAVGGGLDGVLSCHTQNATGSPPPALRDFCVEADKVKMRVLCIVALLVVDGRNISRHSEGQMLGIRCHQFPPLVGACFNRQGYCEAFTDPPGTAYGVGLCLAGGLVVVISRKPLCENTAGGRYPCDVAKMCQRLTRLGYPAFYGAFARKCLH